MVSFGPCSVSLQTMFIFLTISLVSSVNRTHTSLDLSPIKALQSIGSLINVPRATESGRAVANAYYDFIINEGSYKFWAIFQLATVAILLYSVFAAIYFAKYMYLTDPPTADNDDFFKRAYSSAVSDFNSEKLDISTMLTILQALDAARLNRHRARR